MAESGSATGNPRNKVALQPGHALMDWIRLGNSGVDLAGTGGKPIQVTLDELKRHGNVGDAWICIRGNVYNVTRYADFHPGGVDELMRGVGTDATELFDSVHPWVNYASLLSKCLVGKLTQGQGALLSPTGPSPSRLMPPPAGPSTMPPGIKSDWYQQAAFVAIVIYPNGPIRRFHLNIKTNGELWVFLNDSWIGWSIMSVKWPPAVSLPANQKIEVRLSKEGPPWQELPRLQSSSKPVPTKLHQVAIKSIQQISYNVYVIGVNFIDKVFEYVPVGWHVTLKANIKGETVERQYTPIALSSKEFPFDMTFMIKSYTDGVFSSWITTRKVNDVLSVGQAIGSFSTSVLTTSHLVLVSAGTGFTPMYRLIQSALQSTKKIIVKLLFFNKTEKDIIWKTELSKMMSTNSRFTVEHVLSEPDSSWKGKRGWITPQLLEEILPDFSKSVPLSYYVCVCGPTSFTQLTERYLIAMGYTPEHYFCFR